MTDRLAFFLTDITHEGNRLTASQAQHSNPVSWLTYIRRAQDGFIAWISSIMENVPPLSAFGNFLNGKKYLTYHGTNIRFAAEGENKAEIQSWEPVGQ